MRELDIRLYDATDKRMYLPQSWIDTIEFEIGERGGYQNGTMQIVARWEELPLIGNEYVDVYLWGQRVYRGFVKTPQHEIGTPERMSPSLYGFMEILNGYLVRRCLCYVAPVDVTQVFTDLMNRYVKTPGRWASVALDINGGQPIGVTVQQFCAKDSTIPQALNRLCDLAPNQMIWGCDVEPGTGVNRIYLRARASVTKYGFAIGANVSGYVLPSDSTQVVNSVHLVGGTLDGNNGVPNLLTNAAFEECSIPGETTSNLLLNASFEDNNGDNSANFWARGNDPTLAFGNGAARTGNAAFVMDNNPRTPETLSQIVPVPGINGLVGSFWYKTGGANTFQVTLNLLDASSTLLYTASSPVVNATQDSLWHKYEFTYPNFPTDANIAYAQIVLTLPFCANDSLGLIVDDFALWYPDIVITGWGIGRVVRNTPALLSSLLSPCSEHQGQRIEQGKVHAERQTEQPHQQELLSIGGQAKSATPLPMCGESRV